MHLIDMTFETDYFTSDMAVQGIIFSLINAAKNVHDELVHAF